MRTQDVEYEVYHRLLGIGYLQRTVKLDVRHGVRCWKSVVFVKLYVKLGLDLDLAD